MTPVTAAPKCLANWTPLVPIAPDAPTTSPGPALLRDHDGVIGCLRADGFTVAAAAHTFSVLDSYVYGVVLTEVNLPMTSDESVGDFAEQLDLPADHYPHLTEMVRELVAGHDFRYADEFEVGLGMILDQVELRFRARP